MSTHLWRRALRTGLAAAIVVTWLLATIPWGLPASELVLFAAPGAILGLTFTWVRHAFTPRGFTWGSGLRAALTGAGVLPPILGFLIAISGLERPLHLVPLVTLGSWLVVGLGLVVGLASCVGDTPDAARRRARVRETARRLLLRRLSRRRRTSPGLLSPARLRAGGTRARTGRASLRPATTSGIWPIRLIHRDATHDRDAERGAALSSRAP